MSKIFGNADWGNDFFDTLEERKKDETISEMRELLERASTFNSSEFTTYQREVISDIRKYLGKQ